MLKVAFRNLGNARENDGKIGGSARASFPVEYENYTFPPKHGDRNSCLCWCDVTLQAQRTGGE